MHISVDSHILLYTLGYHPILCYLYCPSNLFQFVSRSFSDFLLEFQGPFYCISAWKIPWMEEPSGLQFMGSLRVGHDWATSLSLHFHALEKETATHSSVLAWRIPETGEPGGLPSMGSQSRTRLKWLSNSNSNGCHFWALQDRSKNKENDT